LLLSLTDIDDLNQILRRITFTLASFIMSKEVIKLMEVFEFKKIEPNAHNKITDFLEENFDLLKSVLPEAESIDHMFELSKDFFGILKDQDFDAKSSSAIEHYMFVFRFSIERLKNNLQKNEFSAIILQYIKLTKL